MFRLIATLNPYMPDVGAGILDIVSEGVIGQAEVVKCVKAEA